MPTLTRIIVRVQMINAQNLVPHVFDTSGNILATGTPVLVDGGGPPTSVAMDITANITAGVEYRYGFLETSAVAGRVGAAGTNGVGAGLGTEAYVSGAWTVDPGNITGSWLINFTDSNYDHSVGSFDNSGGSSFHGAWDDPVGASYTIPVYDFTGTPRILEAGNSVVFTDLSTSGTAWLWEYKLFSDAGWTAFTTSAVQNPTQTFAASGRYDIRLTVDGTEVITKNGYILVTASCSLGADIYVVKTSGDKLSSGTDPEGDLGARGLNKMSVTMNTTEDLMGGGIVYEKKLDGAPDGDYVVFAAHPNAITHIFDATDPYKVDDEEINTRFLDIT
jgi:PKD repeat protein